MNDLPGAFGIATELLFRVEIDFPRIDTASENA
jgi:hypothetical protein